MPPPSDTATTANSAALLRLRCRKKLKCGLASLPIGAVAGSAIV